MENENTQNPQLTERQRTNKIIELSAEILSGFGDNTTRNNVEDLIKDVSKEDLILILTATDEPCLRGFNLLQHTIHQCKTNSFNLILSNFSDRSHIQTLITSRTMSVAQKNSESSTILCTALTKIAKDELQKKDERSTEIRSRQQDIVEGMVKTLIAKHFEIGIDIDTDSIEILKENSELERPIPKLMQIYNSYQQAKINSQPQESSSPGRSSSQNSSAQVLKISGRGAP